MQEVPLRLFDSHETLEETGRPRLGLTVVTHDGLLGNVTEILVITVNPEDTPHVVTSGTLTFRVGHITVRTSPQPLIIPREDRLITVGQ